MRAPTLLALFALLPLSLLPLTGCGDGDGDIAELEIGPNSNRDLPNARGVRLLVRTIGYAQTSNGAGRPPVPEMLPSVDGVRVVDDDETLADGGRMYESETLRFLYDDEAYELTIAGFHIGDTPADNRVHVIVEEL